MAYDIFISYKRKGTSSATAAYLYELLLRKGYNVFFDRKEMRSGKFKDQLLEHISNAQDIIILLEEESLQSWFEEKDELQARKEQLSGGREEEPRYKTDWFCREVIHALNQPNKNIIPLLLNGYRMPDADDLPPEMKDLPMMQALSLDISEIEDTYQRYFVEKEYLKSKPRNLALSRQYQNKGGVVGSFLFYTKAQSCELYECGEKIITLTDDNDEQHPFRYPVTFSGEHRFHVINNETCEQLFLSKRVENTAQEYISVEFTDTVCPWSLTEEQIKEETDKDSLYKWAKGLFDGTATHEPNIALSLVCLRRAIELGSTEARDFITSHGDGLKARRAVAADWYQIAAENGSADAQYNLGYMYEFGLGVEKDAEKAVEWYTKAAEQGHAEAQYYLGSWYARLSIKGEPHYDKAEWWLYRAARQGQVDAQYALASMYANGIGVEPDPQVALEWYTKAAEQEHERAQMKLAAMYENGNGIRQNYQKALEWYTKAAEQGNDEAQQKVEELKTLMANG